MTNTNLNLTNGRYGENLDSARVRTMTLFYLFDSSGSMAGTKINQVNYAMKDIPNIMIDIEDSAPNASLKIAAQTFDTTANWITPKPQTPQEFKSGWHDITAGGATALGAALNNLKDKLSKKGFLGDNPLGHYQPGIIIISDGEPNDDWKTPLNELKNNNWFKNSIKVGFAVGEDANKDILAEVCGSKEAVITITNTQKLRDYIKFVTATVSRTGTTSVTDGKKSAQDIVNTQIQNANDTQPFIMENLPDINDQSQW